MSCVYRGRIKLIVLILDHINERNKKKTNVKEKRDDFPGYLNGRTCPLRVYRILYLG